MLARKELFDMVFREPIGTFLMLNYHTPDGLYYSEVFKKISEEAWLFHGAGKNPSVHKTNDVAYAIEYVGNTGVWSLS